MRKLIHSSFELDLSTFKISDTEENNWFSDSFFTKYSFPFDIDLTDDLDVAFGLISLYNTNPQTYYECKYIHNNKIEDAIFEIESHQQKLSCTLRFGFEQLPSFDKKLSELSLDKFNLPEGTDIYEHAETIITQTWPAVNYNFPQVHIDKYDVTDDLWNAFGGIINNRVSGAFLTNTVDIVGEVNYNRNVIQPLPYWIHILQRGMIDGGYTLSGKILMDPRLQKATLYGDVDYFKTPVIEEPISINLIASDATNYSETPHLLTFNYNTQIYNIGKYRIEGEIIAVSGSYVYSSTVFIKYKEQYLYSYIRTGGVGDRLNIKIDFNTTNDLNPHEISIEMRNQGWDRLDDPTERVSLTISLLYLTGSNGVAVPLINNENKIDLTKAVPDITFLDFIKVVKNWFNYDLTVEGKLAIMNPIEDEVNYDAALDLSFTEVKYPLRKFSQGSSFLLKFQDIDNKDYTFLPVFQNQSSVVNSNYVTDDKTTTIEVNALPLPLLTRNEVQTAYALESNNAKAFLVKYDGIFNGNNLAQSNSDYLIPAVHLAYWTKWFQFRINAHGFNWRFKVWNETILNLKAKTKIFAYKRVHIIKTINKTEVQPDLFEIELDCEALE